MGPSQVVNRLRQLNIVDAATLDRINDIRGLRIRAVHGSAPVDLADLKQATKFLESFMHDSQLSPIDGIEEITEQANIASSSDSLTGLSNRRVFELRVSHEFMLNPQQCLSLLMIDLDKFKLVNDTYGHICGDEVIKAVANVLRANARSTDIVARYGGEELSVLLPNTNKQQALAVAEQSRLAVERMTIPPGKVPPVTGVTASIGINTVTPATTDWQQSLRDTVVALYAAKNLGRNRVVHFADIY